MFMRIIEAIQKLMIENPEYAIRPICYDYREALWLKTQALLGRKIRAETVYRRQRELFKKIDITEQQSI